MNAHDCEKKKDVAQRFGIQPSTLSAILKNKDQIPVGHSPRENKRCRKVELSSCLIR